MPVRIPYQAPEWLMAMTRQLLPHNRMNGTIPTAEAQLQVNVCAVECCFLDDLRGQPGLRWTQGIIARGIYASSCLDG